MESLFNSLSESWAAHMMYGWTWSWPISETIHFFGMTILFGAIAVTDLRLLGFYKKLPIQNTHVLINIAIFGFVLNLITGLLFFAADPFNYSSNPGFQMKMLFIVLAGLNALYFTFKLQPTWGEWDQHGTPPLTARMAGGASLLLWTGVIIFGRLLPYTGGTGG